MNDININTRLSKQSEEKVVDELLKKLNEPRCEYVLLQTLNGETITKTRIVKKESD